MRYRVGPNQNPMGQRFIRGAANPMGQRFIRGAANPVGQRFVRGAANIDPMTQRALRNAHLHNQAMMMRARRFG